MQTPRAGAAVTHRLVTLFCNTPVPAPLTGVRGARAMAEPAIELWLRQMLGDLRQVIYAAEFVDAAGRVLLRARTSSRSGALVAVAVGRALHVHDRADAAARVRAAEGRAGDDPGRRDAAAAAGPDRRAARDASSA